MYYIKGDSKRENEVIKLLESKGGHNGNYLAGNLENSFYCIDKFGNIFDVNNDEKGNVKRLLYRLGEELHLPEKKDEWKPKYKVGEYVVYNRYNNGAVYDKLIKKIEEINYDTMTYRLSNQVFCVEESEFYRWVPKHGDTVLVRNSYDTPWREAIYSFLEIAKNEHNTVGGGVWDYCIPFDIEKLGRVCE